MEDVVNLINGPGGALVLAIFIIATGVRGLWVFGWLYKDIKAERDEWKEAALRGISAAETAVSVHEKAVKDGPTA